ncbi:hypothetical protein AMTRI_Chr10g1230 [Amborella trichopoda]
MWLQKVYCWSAYLYCRSACLYCRSDLFNPRSVVAPEGILPERIFVLPERVFSLLEQPIQPPERYGSKTCTVGASPCIAETRVFIIGAFKWTARAHGERVVGKSHEEIGGSLVVFFFCFELRGFLQEKMVVGKKLREKIS